MGLIESVSLRFYLCSFTMIVLYFVILHEILLRIILLSDLFFLIFFVIFNSAILDLEIFLFLSSKIFKKYQCTIYCISIVPYLIQTAFSFPIIKIFCFLMKRDNTFQAFAFKRKKYNAFYKRLNVERKQNFYSNRVFRKILFSNRE